MAATPFSIDQALAHLQIEALNPMQEAAIAANNAHHDVVLLSKTGSGKTLAFLLPLLQRIDPANRYTQALVIVPSRELALQIDQVLRSMRTGYKVTCCYGGHLRETEENNLLIPPAIIVGTAGRLADHIRRGNITIDTIETLVLDEFDKSLELGFVDEMSYIIRNLPIVNKRMLTSATMVEDIPDFVGLTNPHILDFLPEDETPAGLELKYVHAGESEKPEMLFKLLCLLGGRSTIVFCNQREMVERMGNYLGKHGIVNVFYHGAMDQKERDSALCKFRNGTSDVLITTDLASRGLDIAYIRFIVHFDIPPTAESFTHRNGRTARMEETGTAIMMLPPGESIPAYIDQEVQPVIFPADLPLPEKPKWTTLFISAGKKDKVNKVDIVGFLAQKGGLKKDDIGLIEVKDYFAFAAVRKNRVSHMLHLVQDQKLKNKKVKIEVAK